MIPSNWYENSVCNGCEYGERVTGGVFCIETQGLVPTGYQGCKAQNDYYDKMYKNEKRITLSELALELRKTFNLDYLTAEHLSESYIRIWRGKPGWSLCAESWYYGKDGAREIAGFFQQDLVADEQLDLSEYKDKNGDIDYSKCIVEVE